MRHVTGPANDFDQVGGRYRLCQLVIKANCCEIPLGVPVENLAPFHQLKKRALYLQCSFLSKIESHFRLNPLGFDPPWQSECRRERNDRLAFLDL